MLLAYLRWLLVSSVVAIELIGHGEAELLGLVAPGPLSVWYEGSIGFVQWSIVSDIDSAGGGALDVGNVTRFTMELVSASFTAEDALTSTSGLPLLIQDQAGLEGTLLWNIPTNCFSHLGRIPCFQQGGRYMLRFTALNGGTEVQGRTFLFPTSGDGFAVSPRSLVIERPSPLDPDIVLRQVTATYEAGREIVLSWRASNLKSDATVSVYLMSPYLEAAPVGLIVGNGQAAESRAVTIPNNTPSGTGYWLYFITSPLTDTIDASLGYITPLQLRARSSPFRVRGPSLWVLNPNGATSQIRIGETLAINWALSEGAASAIGMVNFDVVPESSSSQDTRLRIFSDVSIDGSQGQVSWQIPNTWLYSGRHKLIVTWGSIPSAVIFETTYFSVLGFVGQLNSPVGIDAKTFRGDSQAPTTLLPMFQTVLPIRWTHSDPGQLVDTVSIFVEPVNKQLGGSLELANGIPISAGQFDWEIDTNQLETLLQNGDLSGIGNVPFRVLIVPDDADRSQQLWLVSDDIYFVGIGDPALNDRNQDLSAASAYARDFVTFNDAENTSNQWRIGSSVQLPFALQNGGNGARQIRLAMIDWNSRIVEYLPIEVVPGATFTLPSSITGNEFYSLIAYDANEQARILGLSRRFLVESQAGQIIRPINGSGYMVGEGITITWDAPSEVFQPGQLERITLTEHGTNLPITVANVDVTSSSEFAFFIPCDLRPAFYDLSIGGKMSSVLAVMSPIAGITFPRAGNVWRPGSDIEIRWVVDGITSKVCFPENAKVKVDLMWGTSPVVFNYTLAQAIPNSGSLQVSLPGEILSDRSDYFIQIIPVDTVYQHLQIRGERFSIYGAPLGEVIVLRPEDKLPTFEPTSAPSFAATITPSLSPTMDGGVPTTQTPTLSPTIETLARNDVRPELIAIITALAVLLFVICCIGVYFSAEIKHVLLAEDMDNEDNHSAESIDLKRQNLLSKPPYESMNNSTNPNDLVELNLENSREEEKADVPPHRVNMNDDNLRGFMLPQGASASSTTAAPLQSRLSQI